MKRHTTQQTKKVENKVEVEVANRSRDSSKTRNRDSSSSNSKVVKNRVVQNRIKMKVAEAMSGSINHSTQKSPMSP